MKTSERARDVSRMCVYMRACCTTGSCLSLWCLSFLRFARKPRAERVVYIRVIHDTRAGANGGSRARSTAASGYPSWRCQGPPLLPPARPETTSYDILLPPLLPLLPFALRPCAIECIREEDECVCARVCVSSLRRTCRTMCIYTCVLLQEVYKNWTTYLFAGEANDGCTMCSERLFSAVHWDREINGIVLIWIARFDILERSRGFYYIDDGLNILRVFK